MSGLSTSYLFFISYVSFEQNTSYRSPIFNKIENTSNHLNGFVIKGQYTKCRLFIKQKEGPWVGVNASFPVINILNRLHL